MKILPVCYFPPVHWFAAICSEEEILLEVCQHYRKQQLTSRTHILVANRVLPLTIPVKRRGAKIPIKDKKISLEENWALQHWRSLESAYKNSPFFEYYDEEIKAEIFNREENLLNYLMSHISLMNSLMGITTRISFTEKYVERDSPFQDLRGDFDSGAKNLPSWFNPRPYPQVFGEFQAGLSILDLLFNLGPESKAFLLDSKFPS
ncbi:MAG: WbqC family protein [Bacteroidia bacterium]|nr:WbqC family protein [Bacteroidia bacterium]